MSTVPTDISNHEILQIADLIGMHFRETTNQESQDNYKIDLNALLTAMKADVSYGDSKESSIIDTHGKMHIFIPNMTSVRRDRFTIAHEIGHYFLHYRLVQKQADQSEPVTFGRGERNHAETQANVFASALLMPKDLFTKAFEQYNHDIFLVAQAFNVSEAAASVRAKVLGLKEK